MKKTTIKVISKVGVIKKMLLNRINGQLKNDRGNGVIEAILFTCIVILAVLAIRPTILSTFINVASAFGSWISTKSTELFQ